MFGEGGTLCQHKHYREVKSLESNPVNIDGGITAASRGNGVAL